MPEFKLNGKTYSGSTSYASAIDYTEADGSKTTVQDKISEIDGDKLKIKYVSIATEPIAGSIDYTININTLKAEVSDMKEYKGFIPFSIAPVTTWQTYAEFLNQTYDNIIIHTIGTHEQQYQIYGYIVYI